VLKSRKLRGKVKVHLGPGQKNYIPKWINIDANIFSAKADLWADLRYRLPFHNSTVDAVYSHHMIEHLHDLYKEGKIKPKMKKMEIFHLKNYN
jgi:predicted SAM-dependent methyltransferase